jgi:hypothetical protein
MLALESRACKTVKSLLKNAEWTVHAFDWFPVFSICRRYDLYEENKTLFPKSYELYRPSRPDFLAKSPTQSKCLVEVKGKSKHDLIIDDYKYDSYIYWERFLGFPVFVVFYVSSEARKGQTGLYLHKVQDVDIRVGEIRYDGKGFINIENKWNDAALWQIKRKEELAKELNRQLQKWNPSHSHSRWGERKGSDLITKSGIRFLTDLL